MHLHKTYMYVKEAPEAMSHSLGNVVAPHEDCRDCPQQF